MIALLLSVVLAGPLPDEQPANPFLQQAKELYEHLDFEKCMQRIKQATQWKGSSVRDLRDIELFGALCSLNLNQRAEAAERFKLALRIDEDLELPEFASPKAVKLFLYVKRKLRGPVPPMPDEDLPPDAPTPSRLEPAPKSGDKTDPVEVTSPGLSRFAGPIALGGVAVAGLAIGTGLGLNAKGLESRARREPFENDYLELRSQAQGNAVGANLAFGVAAAAAIAAVLVLVLQ